MTWRELLDILWIQEGNKVRLWIYHPTVLTLYTSLLHYEGYIERKHFLALFMLLKHFHLGNPLFFGDINSAHNLNSLSIIMRSSKILVADLSSQSEFRCVECRKIGGWWNSSRQSVKKYCNRVFANAKTTQNVRSDAICASAGRTINSTNKVRVTFVYN